MFNSEVLEVFIGLVFVVLLYSILATIVMEMIHQILGLRARVLAMAIDKMLSGKNWVGFLYTPMARGGFLTTAFAWVRKKILNRPTTQTHTLAEAFFDHPRLESMVPNKHFRKPSYINPKTFAAVLLDILDKASPDTDVRSTRLGRIQATLEKGKGASPLANPQGLNFTVNKAFSKELIRLIERADGDLKKLEDALADWYNETTQRSRGWFKRYNNIILFWVGLVIVAWGNVNAFDIVHQLSINEEARKELVATAEAEYQSLYEAYGRIVESLPDEQAPPKANQEEEKAYPDSTQAPHSKQTALDSLWARMALLNSEKKSLETQIQKTNYLLGLGWTERRKVIVADMEALKQWAAGTDTPSNMVVFKDGRKQELLEKLESTMKQGRIERDGVLVQVCVVDSKESMDAMKAITGIDPKAKKHFKAQQATVHMSGAAIWQSFRSAPMRTGVGLLVMALGISLGAPFWFDVLNRLMRLRSSLSQKEAKKETEAATS